MKTARVNKRLKSICLFCTQSKCKEPALCRAKGSIIRSYVKQGLQMWQVLAGIHNGLIPLHALALEQVHKKRPRSARRSRP